MRAVLQRVSYAKVTVEGKLIASVNKGIMALVGFQAADNRAVMEYMLNKIIKMRIFEDENQKMNLSVADIKGELLIVPNFTLYGDARKGNRPSYSFGSKPEEALKQFEEFVKMAKASEIPVQSGQFQADMKVELLNDGPVTLLLDSDKIF